MNRKEHRHLNKLKKKIGELFVLGEISQEEADAMTAAGAGIRTPSQKNHTSDGATAGTSQERDSSQMISRKVAAARQQKQPGPMLSLTLDRLNGVLMSYPEVRDLVQFSVVGPVVTKPKWAYFRPWKSTSQTILIRVNCTPEYIENNEYSLNFVDDFFAKKWVRMHSDVGDREEFWKHMVEVPVSMQEQIREKVKKLAAEGHKGPGEGFGNGGLKKELLVTAADMVDNDYPFPRSDIVATKTRYKPVSENSPIFALDCEMCITRPGSSELTRISLIREDGSVVFDTLVRPYNEITDYLTKFSGITPEMMEDVNVRLEDVQRVLQVVLPPDAILCGHSLEFDLRALRMAHPYCIDIGLIYNLSGARRTKTGLKTLTYLFFNKDIQSSGGHCSVEDSYAALELLRLKLKEGLIFGNCEYGWNYDEWNKKKDEEMRARMDEESKRDPELEEEMIAKKRRRLERERMEKGPSLCACGARIGMDCIIDCCQCQKSPPTKCVLCLANEKDPNVPEENWFDWSDSLRVDNSIKTRPLSFYLAEGNKTVMSGFDATEGVEIVANKIYTVRPPSQFPSLNEYVEEVACDMLQYKLAFVELDYTNREDQLAAIAEASEASEDGELPLMMPRVVEEMDNHIEKIIRSAAKYSLVILVLASRSASVCYLKVKP